MEVKSLGIFKIKTNRVSGNLEVMANDSNGSESLQILKISCVPNRESMFL